MRPIVAAQGIANVSWTKHLVLRCIQCYNEAEMYSTSSGQIFCLPNDPASFRGGEYNINNACCKMHSRECIQFMPCLALFSVYALRARIYNLKC